MAKGYWLPQIDVSDPEGYKAYMAATPPAHQKYNGVALVRGGKSEVVEGRARAPLRDPRISRIMPPRSPVTARPEYQSARPLRLQHSPCDFLIVEGYDGAHPRHGSPPPPRKRAIGSHRSM